MIRTHLAHVAVFASLPPDELDDLVRTLSQVELPASAILFHEGDPGDRGYIVLEGELEVFQALETEGERLLKVCTAGEFIGEMSMLDPGQPRTATVRARSLSRLLEITRTDFEALMRRQPAVAYELARILSSRLRASDQATIRDLQEKNRQLARAYEELKAAQAEIIEKKKLEHELLVARQIQESILPTELPELDGFDFGVQIAPAWTVGGDFFDFIPLGTDRLGIAVCDISGKGISAAIFMALTRSLLRAEASRTASPTEALRSVNTHLLDMNALGMFATALYGILDARTHEFVYVRAGHELPLQVGSEGEVIVVDPGLGQPLGIIPDPELVEYTIVIGTRSTLLLYSDGATDALDEQGTRFGVARLQAALQAQHGATARTLCGRLMHTLTAYRGMAPQHDDITLVAIHAR